MNTNSDPDGHHISEQAGILARLQATLSFREDHSLGPTVTFGDRNSYPIHRWFKYREGFSPEVVRMFLVDQDHTAVLDPFCGSGTTLVEASRVGSPCFGVEVNPLSHLVSVVKTRRYSSRDSDSLRRLTEDLLHASLGDGSSPVPGLRIMGKAFDPEILEALLTFKKAILQTDTARHRQFLLLGWLSILEGVSNTYKEGNGIKYRFRKRTKAGYVELPRDAWQASLFGHDKFAYVRSELESHYNMMLEDVQAGVNGHRGPCTVFRDSVDHLHRLISPESIGAAIFSPPYANCFDYFEIFKIELWMGDFVDSYGDLRQLRRRSIRSHTNADLTAPVAFEIAELEQLLTLMDQERIWSRRIPHMLRGYFDDMRNALAQIFSALRPGGLCAIVVGNSAYERVIIPTDLLLAHIGVETGFAAPRVISARHLTTSSQQKKHIETLKHFLRESIVLLHKPS